MKLDRIRIATARKHMRQSGAAQVPLGTHGFKRCSRPANSGRELQRDHHGLRTGLVLPTTVGFSGSPYRYIGGARPVGLVPIEQTVVQNWSMGPHRFPISARSSYLRFEAFAYPAAFTPGTLGRNIHESPGLNWMQPVINQEFLVRERYRFSSRAELCNLPFKQPNLSQPNSIYNANSPLTFGRFSGDRGGLVNVGGSQPNIVMGLRMEF